MNPIHNEDLVLRVVPNERTKNLVHAYDAFLDSIFDDEYQFLREAAYQILYFFFSENYLNTSDLMKENFSKNPKLQQKYESLQRALSGLQLPKKKNCSVDLATGTGKSFLIYAIAQISLHADLVDQVLVLCPSITIEEGLTEKFNSFAGNRELQDVLPAGKKNTPRIVNANQTIMPGDICVENIHSVYANTNTSIGDSLRGKGKRTLILNDEAHHIYNKVTGSDEGKIKEWKKFLVNDEFDFRYIVNFSGTPYIGDEYFSDIIYRYSIGKAISQRIVKTPSYLIETGKESQMKSFDEIYQNHLSNRETYSEIKPISIIITSDIKTCFEVWEDLVTFVANTEGISRILAESKCIWVTSSTPPGVTEAKRKDNLIALKSVDDSNSPVEWIISVAMLTEGWDVKNVFQIVPHDSRAFNSKLLISQVLGRGLRVPKVYVGREDIKVKIYNHVKFSAEIQRLFDDVLETNERLPIITDRADSPYHFHLHNFSYDKDEGVVQIRSATTNFSEIINLQPQAKFVNNEITYQDALDRTKDRVEYTNTLPWIGLDEGINSIYGMLKAFDLEQDEDIAEQYPFSRIKEIVIKNLLEPSDDFISIENLDRIKAAFRKKYDTGGQTIIYKNKIDALFTIQTSELPKSYTNGAALKKGSYGKLFYSSLYEKRISNQENLLLNEMLESDNYEILNWNGLKSPMLSLASSYLPEKKFINSLIKDQNSPNYDSFIKSTDSGFYSLPYSYKKNTHMKYRNFNPDFFIKKGNQILVIEIKSDEEDAVETNAKQRDALIHFAELNKRQSEYEYIFMMLSPSDYENFFISLSGNSVKKYQSTLMERLFSDEPSLS